MKKTQFFEKIIKFTVNVTLLMEQVLNKGHKVAMFRLSYIKVLWKDLAQLINTLISFKFLPNDLHINRFAFDFKTDSLVTEPSTTDRQKTLMITNLNNQGKINLYNQIMGMLHNMCESAFGVGDIFHLSSRYSPNSFYKTLMKVYDGLLHQFRNISALNRLKFKPDQKDNSTMAGRV